MHEPGGARRVRDALQAGATRHDMATRAVRGFWGIDGVSDNLSSLVRCTEFLPRMPAGGFYSHQTAAALWDLPLPQSVERDVTLHISVPRGRRAPHANQLRGHEVTVRTADITVLQGLPVSSPARVWCELAGVLSMSDLIAAGDALLFHENPSASWSELDEAARSAVFPGKRKAIRALPLLSDRSESRRESHLRFAFHQAGLPPVDVNPEIFDEHGRFVARVDLRFRGTDIVAEYDGDHHRTDARQWRRDVARQADLADLGIKSVHATAADLPHFTRVIARCRYLLSQP